MEGRSVPISTKDDNIITLATAADWLAVAASLVEGAASVEVAPEFDAVAEGTAVKHDDGALTAVVHLQPTFGAVRIFVDAAAGVHFRRTVLDYGSTAFDFAADADEELTVAITTWCLHFATDLKFALDDAADELHALLPEELAAEPKGAYPLAATTRTTVDGRKYRFNVDPLLGRYAGEY